jgi:hypothetical protein
MSIEMAYSAGNRLVTATSATPLTDADLFSFTGTIKIISITGRVTDAHPAAGNNCKLTITSDALVAYDICANKDLTGLAVGTLLSITGTAANAMVATTAVGVLAPGQANMIVATCVTSGKISVVFADTGNQAAAIEWALQWEPLDPSGNVTAV